MTGECHRGQPPLSIVIPTHGTRELTLRCLESMASAAPVVEVIVVDDASADGTGEAIARRHPRVTVMVNEQRAGFARSANRGLAAAAGELLLLLNSDTEVAGESLPALQSAFAEDPRLGIAMVFSGISPDGRLVEIAEVAGHPFMVGTQFHPEFPSRPNRPHPLFVGFLQAVCDNAKIIHKQVYDLDNEAIRGKIHEVSSENTLEINQRQSYLEYRKADEWK